MYVCFLGVYLKSLAPAMATAISALSVSLKTGSYERVIEL